MRCHSTLCRLLVALVAVFNGVAAAENWPRFRGPNGQGIAQGDGIPVRWTEKDYNWRTKLPGGGHSSPAVWGDRIFLTCAGEKTAKRTILCLKAADGTVAWQRDFESTRYRMHHFNHYASSSPSVDADRVYLTWTTPEEVTLLALDHKGKDLWRRRFRGFVGQHGSAASPVLFGDLVLLANDQEGRGKSSLIAVDRATGKTRWQLERRTRIAAYSTPCIYQPDGRPPQLILTSTASGVTGVDLTTGKVDWEIRDAFRCRCASSPAIAGDVVVATAGIGGRGRELVGVRPGSKAKGIPAKVAFKHTRAPQWRMPYVPTPITNGDLLFLWGDDGVVTCLRSATGEQVWRQQVRGKFFGSPVRVADRLYCISMKGEVFVIAAAEEFKLLARNPLGEFSYATPAIANATLYLRTSTHLISLGGPKRN